MIGYQKFWENFSYWTMRLYSTMRIVQYASQCRAVQKSQRRSKNGGPPQANESDPQWNARAEQSKSIPCDRRFSPSPSPVL